MRHIYRQWIRTGIRLFDKPESVLLPSDRISYMKMEDLEAAAQLLDLDIKKGEQNVR